MSELWTEAWRRRSHRNRKHMPESDCCSGFNRGERETMLIFIARKCSVTKSLFFKTPLQGLANKGIMDNCKSMCMCSKQKNLYTRRNVKIRWFCKHNRVCLVSCFYNNCTWQPRCRKRFRKGYGYLGCGKEQIVHLYFLHQGEESLNTDVILRK